MSRKTFSAALLGLFCLCQAHGAGGFRLHEQHPTFSTADRRGYFLIYDYDGSDGEAWLMVGARDRQGSIFSHSPERVGAALVRGQRQRADIVVLRPGSEQAAHTELLTLGILNAKGQSRSHSIALPIDWPAIAPDEALTTDYGQRRQGESQNDAAMCWISADFDCLDAAHANWRDGRAVNADGMSQLDSYIVTLTRLFAASEARVTELRLKQWRRHNPGSAAEALVEALFHRQRAETVHIRRQPPNPDPLAQRLFTEHQKQAQAALLRTSTKSRSPAWHALMLQTMADLGAQPEALSARTSEALRLAPTYLPIYLALAKTDGTEASLARIAALVHAELGDLGYAAFWRRMAEMRREIFDTFPGAINWVWMKQGLIDTARLYPRPAALNQAAIWACRAGDREMYAEFREPLAKTYRRELWPHNQSLDLCDQRFS